MGSYRDAQRRSASLLGVGLLVAAASWVHASCKTRQFSSFEGSDRPEGPLGLDVNDVSFLFPPAGDRMMTAVQGIDASTGKVAYDNTASGLQEADPVINRLLKRGFWPQLVSSPSDKGFLDPKLFRDVVSEIPGFDPVTGHSRISSLGAPRPGAKPSDPRPFNLLDPKRWRVVSFRFLPCGDALMGGHSDTSPGGADILAAAQRPLKCDPTVRVVAQPVVGLDSVEAKLAAALPRAREFPEMWEGPESSRSQGWAFADAAMHLFFRVKDEEVAGLFRRLADVKVRYQGLCPTSGVPLGVHPCLLREMLAAVQGPIKHDHMTNQLFEMVGDRAPSQTARSRWQQIAFANEVLVLLRSAIEESDRLEKIALMMSTKARTPWLFMLYRHELGSQTGGASRMVLDIIPSEDPKAQQISASARERSNRTKPVAPLPATVGDNGESEALARALDQESARVLGNSATKRSEERRILIVPRSQGVAGDHPLMYNHRERLSTAKIAPRPKPFWDSLDVFVRTLSGFQGEDDYAKIFADPSGHNAALPPIADLTGDRMTDLAKVASRIENPFFNNDFSTDCASCHFANVEMLNQAAYSFHYDGRLKNHSDAALLKKLLQQSKQRIGELSPHAMGALAGVTPAALGRHRTPKDAALRPYAMNQFSIYAHTPIVSSRVANESAVSAYLANRWFLDDAAPTNRDCDPVALQLCYQIQDQTRSEGDLAWLESLLGDPGFCQDPDLGACVVRDSSF